MDIEAKRSTDFLPSVSTIGVVISLAILSVGLYGFYNIYLHPLRKFPGPKLWTAYRLPYAISGFRGRLPMEVLEFHRTYGPVVRIAPDELVFSDAAAWDDIQGLLPGRIQNKKDPYIYSPPMPGFDRNIIFANDTTHARLRRIYGPAFTPKAVEEQSGMLLKYADLLVTSLKKAIVKSTVQDMSAWYNFTTFDLTGEFAFSEPFHCLDKGSYHFFVKTIFGGVVDGFKIMQLERYKIWSMLKPLIPASAFQAKVDMDNYTAELVDRRRERGVIPGAVDVFNYLLQSKNEDDRLTRDDLVQNGIVLVVAGSETTATLMTGVTWHLCKNPEKYLKVADEIRSAFRSDGEITLKAVNNLPYMIAMLSEALRVFPPTGFGFARIIGTPGGQSIAGYQVPEKTRCSLFHYAAYHHEHNFTRPNEFIPERWLSDPPSEFAHDNLAVVQPFNVGPRACLGKNLAYAEMRILLAKMLWHFDFELADPADAWFSGLRAYTIWNRPHLMIRLKPVSR